MQQGPQPNRRGSSRGGSAPIGAAAAAGPKPQLAWQQQQGPSPNRVGSSSTGPARVGAAAAAQAQPLLVRQQK